MAIMDFGGWMTAAEAAGLLGLSRQRIHALIASGDLDAVAINPRTTIVSDESVRRLSRARRPQGRPFGLAAAFGVLLELSGAASCSLNARQKRSVRNFLAQADADSVAAKCRRRCEVRRGRLHSAAFSYIGPGFKKAGLSMLDAYAFDATPKQGEGEYYCSPEAFDAMAADLLFDEAPDGNAIFHVCDMRRLENVAGEMPVAFCALDLLESDDPRLHHAGESKLESLIERWRRERK